MPISGNPHDDVLHPNKDITLLNHLGPPSQRAAGESRSSKCSLKRLTRRGGSSLHPKASLQYPTGRGDCHFHCRRACTERFRINHVCLLFYNRVAEVLSTAGAVARLLMVSVIYSGKQQNMPNICFNTQNGKHLSHVVPPSD